VIDVIESDSAYRDLNALNLTHAGKLTNYLST